MPSLLYSLVNAAIRVQSSLPFALPTEIWAWRKYQQKFSKTCDGCNEQKGIYKITYRDPVVPSTAIVPFPIRLCTDCLCDADTAVGVFEDGDSGAGDTFDINRI